MFQEEKITASKEAHAPLGETARIYIMGKSHDVPGGLTILKAMEYAGYRLVRGVGCRGGFCGACATVYRKAGDFRLQVGLACQTGIEDGMYLAQIPFYPAPKPIYDIQRLSPDVGALLRFFPEIVRCLQCNTCTKVCPQGLEEMNYIAAAQQGDLKRVAEISHYHMGLLARRLFGAHMTPKATHLQKRLEEIEKGHFEEELEALCRADRQALERLYAQRVIEPEG